MRTSRLSVYYGPEEETTNVTSNEKQVTLTVDEVPPLLADAIESDRTWLRDFAADQLTISTDLYEVLLAYQHYRRPTA